MTNSRMGFGTKKPNQSPKSNNEIDYIFNLDNDTSISCKVGGVTISMLIDSGSKCNVITND